MAAILSASGADLSLESELSALDLHFLSECAQEELDEAAVLAEAAAASLSTCFEQAIASQPCRSFADAVSTCGLLTEIPALQDCPDAGVGLPRVVVLYLFPIADITEFLILLFV